MEQCGHAITYLSYDSLKRRGGKERERDGECEREMAPIHVGIGTRKATNAILCLCSGGVVMEWYFIH